MQHIENHELKMKVKTAQSVIDFILHCCNECNISPKNIIISGDVSIKFEESTLRGYPNFIEIESNLF